MNGHIYSTEIRLSTVLLGPNRLRIIAFAFPQLVVDFLFIYFCLDQRNA